MTLFFNFIELIEIKFEFMFYSYQYISWLLQARISRSMPRREGSVNLLETPYTLFKNADMN